ncbi:MAG: tetratricopeptide repeat protein [Armatimonadota bacterium]|nr:tetratricopeptide repeat protein [Armatimonadota bacterium]
MRRLWLIGMIICCGIPVCAGRQALSVATSEQLLKDPALIPLTMTESDLKLEYLDLPDARRSVGSQLTLNIPKFSESLYVPARGTVTATVMEPGVRYEVKVIQREYNQIIVGAGRPAELKLPDSEYRENKGSLLAHVSRILDFRMVVEPGSQSRSLMAEVSRLVKGSQTDTAIGIVTKALGRSGKDYTLWNLLGVLYLKNAEPENTEGLAVPATSNLGQALSALDKALKLKTDAAEVHNNLGVAYRKTGDSARAREEFNKAFDMNPGMDPAIYNLVLLDESAKPPVEGKQPVETKPRVDPVSSGGKK